MQKILSTLSFLLVIGSFLFSQGSLNMDHFKELKFRSIGPAGMSGRVTAIDVDLSNTARIFIGTASGGVWKSENGGTTWTPIFDKEKTLSIGSLAINQNNPDEIWVGTGEGNPRNSMNIGGGVYKTIDGGKTWKNMGLENTRVIHRIKIHRDNPDIIYLAAMGTPWGSSKDRGVFKTTDGGKTWNNVLFVNDITGAADMVVDPTNPNKILVGMWEHKRTPWDFVSGGDGSGIYLSYDGGENWKKLTKKEGMPKGNLGRIGLAISPSSPNNIYALIEAKVNGLYKSEDGGEKWKLVSDKNIGNRPFYYSEIYVDPINENRIYNLWSYVSLSEDGGKTFKNIMDYGNNVHPDHHAFWIHPTDPSYIINGNDGGLNISRDRGENWTFMSNIPVGQFYHINYDMDFPFNVYGGMQDNGSWVGPSAVLKRGGIRNYDWHELYFGDGFDVVPYAKDSRYGYAMSQGGNVTFYDRKTGVNKFIKPVHPEGKELRYNWNAAIAADPFNDCGVYFASQYVHYSFDCGVNWEIISPDLTTNDTTKQKQDISGGLTIDATNAENHTTILCVSPSNLNKDIIWVGTDDGNVQLTKDRGKTWVNLSMNIPGFPKGAWIPQIISSTYNEAEAFVVVNNYRMNDLKTYLFHTKDFGKTWQNIAPNTVPFVLSFVQDEVNSNLMFLGTDGGLYFSIDGGKKWTIWGEDIPHVQIRDLKIHPRENSLIVGTFGRSIYILDDITSLRAIAKDNTITKKAFDLLADNIVAYQMEYKPVEGIRFNAQGDFVGSNRTFGAFFNTWILPTDDDEKEYKLKVKVIDLHGDTIRSYTSKMKHGYDRFSWNMRQDGVRYPGSKKPKADDDAPSGTEVMAGVYKLIATLDDQKDSCLIEVKLDPRTDFSTTMLRAQRNDRLSLENLVKECTNHFDMLEDAKENISRVEKIIKVNQDSIPQEWKDKHKNLKSQIESLKKLYVMPDDVKGIQRNPNDVRSMLYTTSSYLGYPNGKSTNVQNQFDITRKKAEESNNAIKEFIEGDWKTYEEEVKKQNFVIIKSVGLPEE